MDADNRGAMYFAAVDVLTAGAQIRDGGSLPAPAALRERMIALLREFVTRCRETRIPDTEIAEARYALVAFIDDRVLQSNWVGRAEWTQSPLQLQFFREYGAGENFFARMQALVRRGAPTAALEVYYLCLALGFLGETADGGGSPKRRARLEPARVSLLRGVSPRRIAPNSVPTERHRSAPDVIRLGRLAVLASMGLVLAASFALHLALNVVVDRARHELRPIAALEASSASPPSGERLSP